MGRHGYRFHNNVVSMYHFYILVECIGGWVWRKNRVHFGCILGFPILRFGFGFYFGFLFLGFCLVVFFRKSDRAFWKKRHFLVLTIRVLVWQWG